MNTLKGSRTHEDANGTARRSRPLAVSIVLHVLLVFALVRFLISPSAFTLIFGRVRSPEVPAERIGFLRLPKSTGPAVEGRSGGDNRPLSEAPRRPLAAPTSVPGSIP